MSLRYLLILVCVLQTHASAKPSRHAAINAPELLYRALAGPTVPYNGEVRSTVSVDTVTGESRMRIFGNGRGATRREYVSGPASGTVLLQVGENAWRKHGESAWATWSVRTDTSPREAAGAICRNYRVTVATVDANNNRGVVTLQVTPVHPYNPSRTLLLDTHSNLILRDEMRGPDGTVRYVTEMVMVNVGPQQNELFRVPTIAQRADTAAPPVVKPCRSRKAMERECRLAAPSPSYVPQGYKPVLWGVMRSPTGTKLPVLRYSDGLGAFTVFRRESHTAAHEACVVMRDRQQVSVNYSSGAAAYLVIGDIAEAELLKVANSLK